MRFHTFVCRATAAALLALPANLRAQTADAPPASIVADAYLDGAYVWRGITFTNRPVVQADVALNVVTRPGTISGGVWANAEPRDYTGAHDIRLIAPGHAGPAVTALTTWFDLTHTAGRLASTVGVTSYWYPSITGYAAQFNSSEIYGRLALATALSPRLAVYMDVEKVRGAYVEASVTAPVPVGAHTLSLGATAGASAGQAVAHNQSAYFARNGVAFGDLSATTAFALRGVSLAPTLHVLLDRDPWTRVTALDGATHAVKSWVGVTASWAHEVPRPRR